MVAVIGRALVKNDITPALLAEKLADRINELTTFLLPNGKRVGREWRCGSIAGEPGESLAVCIHGEKRGIWADFASGERGDALDLVACCLFSGDLKTAYRWSCTYLGIGKNDFLPEIKRQEPVDKTAVFRAEAFARKRRISRAKTLFSSSQKLAAGDPVVRYLAKRKIRLEAPFPGAIRYNSRVFCSEKNSHLPAMISVIYDRFGQKTAVHVTYLEQHNGFWVKAGLNCPKKIFGPYSGGFIPLAPGASGKKLANVSEDEEIILGEGIETCLSVAVSCPEYRVLCACSLSNLGNVKLPSQLKKILILADNDDDNPTAQKALEKAILSLQNQEIRVRVARSPVGSDFNDALEAAP